MYENFSCEMANIFLRFVMYMISSVPFIDISIIVFFNSNNKAYSNFKIYKNLDIYDRFIKLKQILCTLFSIIQIYLLLKCERVVKNTNIH